MRSQREPDLLGRRELIGDRVEACVEGVCALSHRLVEQVLFGGDPGVDRGLLDAESLRKVADRGAVVAPFGEEPGGLAG
jgi:hypothetical protein